MKENLPQKHFCIIMYYRILALKEIKLKITKIPLSSYLSELLMYIKLYVRVIPVNQ